MAAPAPGTPLGLLIRPGYEPVRRRPDGKAAAREPWTWMVAGRPTHWRRVGAAAKLAALVVTLAGGLAASVIVGVGGLWWWLGHLASAGAHH